MLELLPNELITNILTMLHYRDLASSIQLCKHMLDIVEGSTLLQYRLELGRSGMEDGPLSTLSISERRERLKVYNDAWKYLRWSECVELPNVDKGTYGMDIYPGGILTFKSRMEGKIVFVRIPSKLRGTPMRQWELSFPFVPHKYALEPSEDILVVLQPNQGLHFLSLTSGEPHPLAAVPLLSESHHFLGAMDLRFTELSMAQIYLSMLYPKHELCVYDWKNGEIVLSISSDTVQSVSFIPENRFLLATTRLGDLANLTDAPVGYEHYPSLALYDLDQASKSQNVTSPIAVFSLEPGFEFDPRVMVLYYCLDIHSYSDEVAVPFFSLPSEQLIAVGTHDTRLRVTGNNTTGLPARMLLIPIARLTSYIGGATADKVPMRYIPWNEWGATCTRWVKGPPAFRLVHGPLSGGRLLPGPQSDDFADVWDFSRARVAQSELQRDQETLPCVQTRVELPKQMKGHTPVAISEDALICQHYYKPETYLLVF